MKTICLFDPALENNTGTLSSNLGDLIIQEAVKQELQDLFPSFDIHSISTQEKLGLKQSLSSFFADYRFVGGSNLLSSNMHEYKQWRISGFDIPALRDVVLLGVGWWQYQDKPDKYTSFLLRHILSKKYIHSVRDQYTLEMLKSIGILNVYNTGCPTMWRLAAAPDVPGKKADNVLTMLTDYNRDQEADLCLLKTLGTHYKTIYFWPQGRRDAEYIRELGFPVTVLERSLESLDLFLGSDIDCDYIGTRLHGGVRCLANGRRALILAIDNRAKEISSDSNLPVVDRGNIEAVLQWVLQPVPVNLILQAEQIDKWKAQFA